MYVRVPSIDEDDDDDGGDGDAGGYEGVGSCFCSNPVGRKLAELYLHHLLHRLPL